MQQHYSTVAQTEMRQGIAKIISLAGVREAMTSGGMELVWIGPKNENGQLGSDSQLADSTSLFWWALKGSNLRLPPCEDDRGVKSPSEK
ncbi:MAG TPA: hypothetical protein VHG72_02465 [Polyangia bacterium]|nr:hypothetical protein [Polyangia bacterium]